MRDLIKHERFEMEVLEKLHNSKVLDALVFTGGTMLRLCHGLDRYSTDLDFWMLRETDYPRFFAKTKEVLSAEYKLKDSKNKRFSMLFEFNSPKYPRSLNPNPAVEAGFC